MNAIAGWMIFDAQLLGIGDHAKIAVAGVVISLERDPVFAVPPDMEGLRYPQRHTVRCMKLLMIMAAFAIDNIGNFGSIFPMPGKALIRVSVTR